MRISERNIAVIEAARVRGLKVQLHACASGEIQAFPVLCSNRIDPAGDAIDLGFVAIDVPLGAIRDWALTLPTAIELWSRSRHTTASLSGFCARRRRFMRAG